MGSSLCTARQQQSSNEYTDYSDYTINSEEHPAAPFRFPDIDTALAAPPFSIGEPETTFPGLCTRVYDGDTFYVAFEFRGLVNVFTIRLYGIDCPELRPRKALFETEEARLAHKARGVAARNRVSELIKDRNVLVTVRGKEKFGRLLASVYIDTGAGKYDTDLATLLIEEGHGTAYFGGTKTTN